MVRTLCYVRLSSRCTLQEHYYQKTTCQSSFHYGVLYVDVLTIYHRPLRGCMAYRPCRHARCMSGLVVRPCMYGFSFCPSAYDVAWACRACWAVAWAWWAVWACRAQAVAWAWFLSLSSLSPLSPSSLSTLSVIFLIVWVISLSQTLFSLSYSLSHQSIQKVFSVSGSSLVCTYGSRENAAPATQDLV